MDMITVDNQRHTRHTVLLIISIVLPITFLLVNISVVCINTINIAGNIQRRIYFRESIRQH